MLILLNTILELKWPSALSIRFTEIYSTNGAIPSFFGKLHRFNTLASLTVPDTISIFQL